MNLEAVIFYLFALIVLGSGAIVVLSKNIMYSAFALMFTLFGVAGLYAMLLSDFLAVAQIMIYVGGILVLIIFGVMLTSRITGIELKSGPIGKVNYLFGALIAVLVTGSLTLLFVNSKWIDIPLSKQPDTSVNLLGNVLMTEYILTFEVASVVLLIALIGAALIAHKDSSDQEIKLKD